MSRTTPRTAAPPGQVWACRLSEVPLEGAIAVRVAGEPVAVVRTSAGVFALHDACSHAEVPLSQGEVAGCTIECWLHGSRFDLRTGRPVGAPATRPVTTYPVVADGDDVFICLRPTEH